MTLTGLEREIQQFWCGDDEAATRFRSTFLAMLAAHAGGSMGSGPPVGLDSYAEAIDSIRAGAKTYRALRRMETADVVVLYRLVLDESSKRSERVGARVQADTARRRPELASVCRRSARSRRRRSATSARAGPSISPRMRRG